MTTLHEATRVAAVVSDAGGRIVGRTRLQKIAYILEAAGFGDGFVFQYKHYGPYSEELAAASRVAVVLDLVSETEQPASWGGTYSTFTTGRPSDASEARRRIAQLGASADAVQLELAATALFLAKEGVVNPWAETARRKPDKVGSGRLDLAKELYRQLCLIQTPNAFPEIT